MTRYIMHAVVVALLLAATSAIAQQTPTITPVAIPEMDRAVFPADPAPVNADVSEEVAYFWFTRHFARIGDDGTGNTIDSNSTNFSFPIPIGNSEVRGIGQLFAPGVIYDFFLPVYTGNDTAGLIVNHNILEDYIRQFEGAGAYTIDSIAVPWFKNPYFVGDHSYPAKFYVWSTPPSFAGNSYFKNPSGYQRTGFVAGRRSLVPVFESELTQEGFDTTINGTRFVYTSLVFDPPLTFNAGAAAIFMIVNDELPALSNPFPNVDPSDTREFQTVRMFHERIEGTKKRLTNYKAWGTMLWRTGTMDSVVTIWPTIYFSGSSPSDSNAAIMDIGATFQGTVDLSSGVKYHFGTDAKNQGLTAIAPNPARETSRISFELKNVSTITLDLFDAQGQKVRTLVTARYVPGVYSYDLNVNDLPNGPYLIRLQADDQVYTQKMNVVK